ncbi:MAG: YraN family protein [Deltaproteobacteria bacterium]|jgi:putative endonuclease|nr:YraN family protein [Deltaproteobacteria bacterium]
MPFARKTQPPPRHLATGDYGEGEALRHLSARGFSLLARNWRPKGGKRGLELDLAGLWESFLVFVEVKTRRTRSPEGMEGPDGLWNFSPAKRRNMARAAQAYLREHDAWERPCRFDLVCVTLFPGQRPRVDHYRDVIDLGQTLGNGNASWQPW